MEWARERGNEGGRERANVRELQKKTESAKERVKKSDKERAKDFNAHIYTRTQIYALTCTHMRTPIHTHTHACRDICLFFWLRVHNQTQANRHRYRHNHRHVHRVRQVWQWGGIFSRLRRTANLDRSFMNVLCIELCVRVCVWGVCSCVGCRLECLSCTRIYKTRFHSLIPHAVSCTWFRRLLYPSCIGSPAAQIQKHTWDTTCVDEAIHTSEYHTHTHWHTFFAPENFHVAVHWGAVLCMCVCMCVYVYMCTGVCVCARACVCSCGFVLLCGCEIDAKMRNTQQL